MKYRSILPNETPRAGDCYGREGEWVAITEDNLQAVLALYGNDVMWRLSGFQIQRLEDDSADTERELADRIEQLKKEVAEMEAVRDGARLLAEEAPPTVYVSPQSCAPHRCPVCDGRQMVAETFYTGFRDSTGADVVPCKTCGGTGIVWGNT